MCPTTSLSLTTSIVRLANMKQLIWLNFNGTLDHIILVQPPFPTLRPETPRPSSTMADAPTPMELEDQPMRSPEQGAEQRGGNKKHNSRSRSKEKRGNSPKGCPPHVYQLGATSSASGMSLPAGGPAQAVTPESPSPQKYRLHLVELDDGFLHLVRSRTTTTDQWNRVIEGSATRCHKSPKENATGTAGKDYSVTVLDKSKGFHSCYQPSPAHAHKFLASIKYMSEEMQWPDTVVLTVYKTKDSAETEKKDKESVVWPTTEIVWETSWKFSGTVVDDDGVTTDGRQKEVDLSLLMCKAFQQMKFEKSTSGPTPSEIEKKVSELLRKK